MQRRLKSSSIIRWLILSSLIITFSTQSYGSKDSLSLYQIMSRMAEMGLVPYDEPISDSMLLWGKTLQSQGPLSLDEARDELMNNAQQMRNQQIPQIQTWETLSEELRNGSSPEILNLSQKLIEVLLRLKARNAWVIDPPLQWRGLGAAYAAWLSFAIYTHQNQLLTTTNLNHMVLRDIPGVMTLFVILYGILIREIDLAQTRDLDLKTLTTEYFTHVFEYLQKKHENDHNPSLCNDALIGLRKALQR